MTACTGILDEDIVAFVLKHLLNVEILVQRRGVGIMTTQVLQPFTLYGILPVMHVFVMGGEKICKPFYGLT